MAQDVEATQEKPPNACRAALKDKNTKLLEKCEKLEDLKNEFRECTELIQEKYDEIVKEKESLKIALEESNLQANMWKDEKEKEAGRRIDLEDEVSALKDEVRSLKQNVKSTSEEADKQLQKHLAVAKNNIVQLNVLLDQERGRVAVEKKKADEDLKKAERGKNNVSEAQKVVNAERKKAQENRVLLEKLRKETDDLKSVLALEKSKAGALEKKVDAEKQKAIRERTRADSAMAKSEEQRKIAEAKTKFEKDRADYLNRKLEEAKKKAEAAEKKVEAEKQRAVGEREKADMAVAKSEEQREIAETNLKMATFEMDRADDLNQKLEEANKKVEAAKWKVEILKQRAIRERKMADMAVAKSEEQRKLAEMNSKMALSEKDRADALNMKLEEAKNRIGKIEKEMHKTKCSGILAEAQDLQSNAGRDAELTSNACAGMLKNDSQILEKIHCQLIVIGNQLSVMTPANLGAPVTDSRMDPPYGGSYQKIIQSSATTSSPAYFADRPLVGSLERGTLSVMTPANLGEGLSNCEPSIGRSSEKMRTRYNEPGVSESLKESSCRELLRPCKKRKTSFDGTVAIHSLQNYVEPENMLNSNTNSPNDCMLASSPEPDLMKLHGHFKDGMHNA